MYVAVVAGMISALVGAGHLAAWLGGYLTQRGLSAITMKTNAALCLTLVGVALILLVPTDARSVRRWAARMCAALVLVVGLLTFVENLSGWGFGIDQLLAAEAPGAKAVASPNRMGTPASLSFTLLGLALWMLGRRDRRGASVVQALALAVCLIALLSTIGFLYGAQQFYGIAQYTGIAWPTAASLLLLGVGLLCVRPVEGLMAQVTADDPGGLGLRRLLPFFVVLPLLLGWLRLAGERAGVFDAATGTGMVMLLFIVIFSALTYHTGRRTSRAARVLRESEERYRTLFSTMTEGFALHEVICDEQGKPVDYRLLDANPAFERLTGLKRQVVIGKTVREALPGIEENWISAYTLVAMTGAPAHFEWYNVDLGRHYEVYAYRPAPRQFAVVFMDITGRKKAEAALRWSARRDELLSDTAARLLQSEDPQGIVEELCRQVMGFLDCQAFFNFLVDEPSGRLRLNACAGIPEDEMRKVEWLDFGVAVCGCVARDGDRIIAEDIPSSPDPRTTLIGSYGIRAYCCHPLKIQDRLIGTLSFGTRSRTRFRPEEIEVMKVVGDLVAIAMHRIEIEKTLRDLNATLETKVVQRTAELAHRAQQLQRLTLELTQAEERERRRIAVILHEDLQQQIAGAKFQLSLVRSRARDDSLRAHADKVDAMLAGAIGKSCSLSHDLSPAVVHMTDLAEVLRWLVHRMEAQHGLSVKLDIAGDMTLHSEALAMFLFRAARELLFNVVKHAHIREAAIRARRIGRYVCLSLSDQGQGFDPRELKETSGIGLFSIRERTELLGGRLNVRSGKGKGTRCDIIVPDDQGRRTRDREQGTESGRDFSVAPDPPSSVLRVLLADDHDVAREGLAALLQEAPDIAVIGQATDGREAIAMADALRPDVVIMDVSMPGMSGDEATRQIKTRLPKTRVIALSMFDEVDKKERMYQAGAENYVLKTATPEELLATIRDRQAAGSRACPGPGRAPAPAGIAGRRKH